MTTSSSLLLLDAAAVPTTAKVVGWAAQHGHALGFPEGFALNDESHQLWLPVTLNGEKTGFDYGIFPVAQLLDDKPELNGIADSFLDFGARGERSLFAMSLVQRAICELTGAQGYWEEERLSNDDMVDFCKATMTAIAEQPRPASPAAPAIQSDRASLDPRVAHLVKALVLAAAIFAAIPLTFKILGYFFGPETGQ